MKYLIVLDWTSLHQYKLYIQEKQDAVDDNLELLQALIGVIKSALHDIEFINIFLSLLYLTTGLFSSHILLLRRFIGQFSFNKMMRERHILF